MTETVLTGEGRARDLLSKVADNYELKRLKNVLEKHPDAFPEKDVFVCTKNILAALDSDTPREALQEAKNIYGGPIFAVNAGEGKFRIENIPDPNSVIEGLKEWDFCFELSAYSVVNTLLAILIGQVTGFNLKELVELGEGHLRAFIEHELAYNSVWDRETLRSESPILVMPVGAAGSGKSTFFKELGNFVNISCDNIRYLLFRELGPCFAPWESALSWWVVNCLTDRYIRQGYSVFYNGVNTDPEYRSPTTMENPDELYQGMPYKVKIVYFEPPVRLDPKELEELKAVNLWTTPIDRVDTESLSPNVRTMIEFIRTNYQRTLDRTSEITSGRAEQDPFDVMYSVPPAIVKLFVEQSYNVPGGDNVIVIPRKEIPDAEERARFYKRYAAMVRGE